MQAIITKFLGPTNFRGARVKATAAAGSVTVPWDHALGVLDNHKAATVAFAKKFNWGVGWIGGSMPDDSGFCFVRIEGGYAADGLADTVIQRTGDDK